MSQACVYAKCSPQCLIMCSGFRTRRQHRPSISRATSLSHLQTQAREPNMVKNMVKSMVKKTFRVLFLVVKMWLINTPTSALASDRQQPGCPDCGLGSLTARITCPPHLRQGICNCDPTPSAPFPGLYMQLLW